MAIITSLSLLIACSDENEKNVPAIISIEPQTVFVGDTLTIRGKNFSSDAANTIVQINSKTLTVIAASAEAIRAKIPDGTTSGILSLTTNGSTITSTDEINVFGIPTVIDMVPVTGSKGSIVTIYGNGFSDIVSDNSVTFNGKPAVITSASETWLKVIVPPAAGDGPVLVSARGRAIAKPLDFKFQWSQVVIMQTPSFPESLALDKNGDLYFFNNSLGIFKRVGANVIAPIAGNNEGGHQDGVGSVARFFDLNGMAIDENLTIYALDATRIREITQRGVLVGVNTIAGNTYGFADGKGSAAMFSYPRAIVVGKDGNLYIADRDNHAIRKMTPDGGVSTLAGGTVGFKDGKGTNARFNFPYGLTRDGDGNLYVLDSYNNCIRKVTMDGDVTTLVGNGLPYIKDGPLSEASLSSGGMSIVCDKYNNLYWAESPSTTEHFVRHFSPSGIVTTIATNKDYNYFGIAVDNEGALYVTVNDQIIKMD